MPNILTRTGRHVWLEIHAGTPHNNHEAYYCLKCGQRSHTAWTGPGPENAVCPQGDKVIDYAALHRQPEPPWWTQSVPRGTSSPAPILPHPVLLLGIDTAGSFHPVLFNPRMRGWVVARDPNDATRTLRLLAEASFRLTGTQEIAMIRLPRQGHEALSVSAQGVIPRVHGVYWDLKPQTAGMAYAFAPFGVSNA